MDKYKVELAPEVFEQIQSIKNYITVVLQSPVNADRTVERIFDDLERLELFPKRGFDADEKVGVQLSKQVKSRGISISKGNYLAFYTIKEDEKLVYVTHLVSSKSDYAPLFKL